MKIAIPLAPMAKLYLSLMFLSSVVSLNIKAQTPDYGNNPQAGSYAQINGIKMYYECYGSGQPLVMLHGNGGSINAFRNQIPFFEQHYRVIAIDSRLQGKSGGSLDSLSYEMMADDFAALLDQLQIDSAFVLGWSDGGIDGLLLALRHPGKVKKLAISGANVLPDSTALPASDIKAMQKFVNQPASEPREVLLNRMMLEQPNITWRELQKISVPTLVMAGDHDIILPEHTLRIFRSIPKAELCIFPDASHGVCLQYPDLFNQTVFRFFRK